jgi:hypothetical protein
MQKLRFSVPAIVPEGVLLGPGVREWAGIRKIAEGAAEYFLNNPRKELLQERIFSFRQSRKNNRHVSLFVTKVIISQKSTSSILWTEIIYIARYKLLIVDGQWLIHANERTGSHQYAHLTNPILPAGMRRIIFYQKRVWIMLP